jgi:N-acetylneuraminate synthase
MCATPVDKDAVADQMAPLRRMFNKSVVARVDLQAGTVLDAHHLAAKKPGTGIPAARISELIGARLRRSVQKDEQLLETDIEVVR